MNSASYEGEIVEDLLCTIQAMNLIACTIHTGTIYIHIGKFVSSHYLVLFHEGKTVEDIVIY